MRISTASNIVSQAAGKRNVICREFRGGKKTREYVQEVQSMKNNRKSVSALQSSASGVRVDVLMASTLYWRPRVDRTKTELKLNLN